MAVFEPLFGEFYSAIWDDPAAENMALTVSFRQNYYLKVGVGLGRRDRGGDAECAGICRLVRTDCSEEVDLRRRGKPQ
jgi:hypothetical protein